MTAFSSLFRQSYAVESGLCFVLMPFRPELDEIYTRVIKPAVESEQLEMRCLRADEVFTDQPIISDIWEQIQKAELIVADLTGRNPNVLYELGLCHALCKRVVLVTQKLSDVPFDLKHLRVVIYKPSIGGTEQLLSDLTQALVSLRALGSPEQHELRPIAIPARDRIDHSLSMVFDQVAELFDSGHTDRAIATVHHAITTGVSGGVNDFHNLGSVLARHDHEPLAVQVINAGLRLHPKDVDLLSDAVMFNSRIGQASAAESAVETLRQVDVDSWNWRAFVFVGDHLKAKGNIATALKLYATFRSTIPHDERGYVEPARHFHTLGRLDDAYSLVMECMQKCSSCPQAAFLGAEILHDMGRYADAVAAATRALECNAAYQPMVSQSAVLARRAFARDSQVHRMLGSDDSSNSHVPVTPEIITLARACVQDYATGSRMSDTLPSFKVRAQERIEIVLATLSQHGASSEQLSEVAAAGSAS